MLAFGVWWIGHQQKKHEILALALPKAIFTEQRWWR